LGLKSIASPIDTDKESDLYDYDFKYSFD